VRKAVIASQRVRAMARPMTGSAKQSTAPQKDWIASSLSLLAMTTAWNSAMAKAAKAAGIASGQCLCGKIRFEIDVPARWAWHDHSLAAGARMARRTPPMSEAGASGFALRVARPPSPATRTRRRRRRGVFAAIAARRSPTSAPRSPHMVNIPRALFSGRTGRQPLYHIAIEEIAGVGLYRRAAGAAEGFSRRGLAALEKEKAKCGG